MGDHLGQQTLGAYFNPFHAVISIAKVPGSFGLDSCGLLSVGVEGFLVSQNAPCNACQLVGQGGGQLVSLKPGGCFSEPRTEAEFLPIVRPHQNDVCCLNKQGSQVFTATLGYAAQDGFATSAVLAWNKTEPGPEVSAPTEGVTVSDGGHHSS